MRMSRLLGSVAFAGAMALALLAGYGALASVSDEAIACPESPDPLVSELRMDAPASIDAGELLRVRLLTPGDRRPLPATVALLRADGAAFRETVLRSGVGQTSFGAAATMAAGVFSITAAVCDRSVEQAIAIRPGPATAPLDPLIGPRRIAADGASEATAVTLPVDRLGNPVVPGSEVRYELRRADGRRESERVQTTALLGVLRVRSGTIAGLTRIAASAGDARSTAADLTETPGAPPSGFAIAVEEGVDRTVGSRDREVVLDQIVDEFGNVLVDGTLVTVLVDGPGVVGRSIQAPLIDGSARVLLAPPVGAGDVRVRALVYGVSSVEVISRFAPHATSSEVRLVVHVDAGLGMLNIELGPVLGDLGAYVPDGTEVILDITDPDGAVRSLELRLVDGRGSVEIPAPRDGLYVVRAQTQFGSAISSGIMR